jgi:CBS domain-containing protein
MAEGLVRTAERLMRTVRSVSSEDTALEALATLRDFGVVVLVDAGKRPLDVLTTENLPQVASRAEVMAADARATVLFAPESERSSKGVVSVHLADDLDAVIRTISTNRLWPGVVVVDDQERYAGYIFNEDLRKTTAENVKLVQQMYPEAWATVGAPLLRKGS